MTEPAALLGAIAGLIGGLAAAIGVIYSSSQLKMSINKNFSQSLVDASRIFEDLENSKERNSYLNHENFAVRYFNHCERLAYMRSKNLMDEDMLKYFHNNFLAGLNLLYLKEYTHYQESYEYFWEWYGKNKEKSKYKLFPPANIAILPISELNRKNDNILFPKSEFYPNKFEIARNKFVVWICNDGRQHRIKCDDTEIFDSEVNGPHSLLKDGDQFAHRFRLIGTHKYYCKYHQEEQGTITVT